MAASMDRVDEAIDFAANKLQVEKLKAHQKLALRHFLLGHDIFIALPTGFGKSLVFQAAPYALDFLENANVDRDDVDVDDIVDDAPDGRPTAPKALVIVVLPLKALAVDQLDRVRRIGVDAADITSGIPDVVLEESPKFSIIFSSPEVLFSTRGKELLQKVKGRCRGVFVDESHCVSKWGHSSGESAAFRRVYSQIGELRSVLDARTCMVALTATATVKVRKTVIESLAMRNYELIEESPVCHNIKYVFLKSQTKNFEDVFQWLVKDIMVKGQVTERMIVYCQSRKHVSDLFALFSSLLGKDFHMFFDMYHTNTESDVQKRIIGSFGDEDGVVRVLFATIAFGLGVDVRGVHTIIMIGHPTELDDVMQLSGRGGRDGKQSVSILLDYPGAGAGLKTGDDTKNFMATETCRRRIIQDAFPSKETADLVIAHDCCDLCAKECTCDSNNTCSGKMAHAEEQLRNTLSHGPNGSVECKVVPVSDSEVAELTEELKKYRQTLLTESTHYLYTGEDMACGMSMSTFNAVISECHFAFPVDTFCDRYAFTRREVALAVWNILNTTISHYDDSLSDVASLSDSESLHSISDDDILRGEYAEPEVWYSSDSD